MKPQAGATFAALTALLALAGCDTGSGGPSVDPYDMQTIDYLDLDRSVGAMAPTALDELPGGRVGYEGVVGFSDAPTTGNVADFDLMSDLSLLADFGTGAVTGTIDNFTNSDNERIDGSLKLTEGQIAGGGFTANAIGSVDQDEDRLAWDLDLTTTFVGPSAEGLVGTANGTATNGGSITNVVYGDLLAERD